MLTFALTPAGAALARGGADAHALAGLRDFRAASIDGPLVTDRPDFTESTLAVPLGRAQIEAGLTFTHHGTDADSFGAPEALLRVGVLPGFELRIGAPGFAWEDRGPGTERGLTDSSLGFKLELGEQSGAAPSLAVIGQLSIPTGADAFTSDRADPSAILAWAYDVGDTGWSIAGNAGVTFLEDRGGDLSEEFSASVALGAAVTGELGFFAEYFGFYRNGAASGPEHYFNTGLTWLVSNNAQLDFRVGAGLNGRSDSLFTGAGVSFRF